MDSWSSSGFNVAVRLSGLVLVVALSGCAKLGPEFTKPASALSDDWIESNPQLKRDDEVLQAWWTIFDDPVLARLIEIAREENLPLQIAALRLLEARAELGIATGELYPQLQQLNAGANYDRSSHNQVDTAEGDLNAWSLNTGLDAVWELDFWGRFRRGIESADAELSATVADYQDALVSLTAEVALAYTAMRTFEERLAIARENVAIQKQSFEIAETQFRNGVATELDLQQARALLKNTQATIPAIDAGIRESRNALAILLGAPPGTIEHLVEGPGTIPVPPSEVAVGVPAELLRRRPDIRRAELSAAAQSARIGIAITDLYPKFTLTGSIGFATSAGTRTTRSGDSGFDELFGLDSLTVFAGPSISWNIFNYGRLKNNVRVQDARFQQRLVYYEQTVLRAAKEVEDAMDGFSRAQDRAGFLAAGVEAAKRAVDISLIQYRGGVLDYQRVLDSQGTLLSQQDQWTRVRGDVTKNLIVMYKALGGGWRLEDGRPVVADPIKAAMRARTDWGELLDGRTTKAVAE
ncbi:MAG: efflux transporter outer membrane subunit [Pseudomonadota bacterium]